MWRDSNIFTAVIVSITDTVDEQGTHEWHQEGLDGVEFSGGDGPITREVVDDVPWLAVV
jgi:hypothetical protein